VEFMNRNPETRYGIQELDDPRGIQEPRPTEIGRGIPEPKP
jgi:hypothetical protein